MTTIETFDYLTELTRQASRLFNRLKRAAYRDIDRTMPLLIKAAARHRRRVRRLKRFVLDNAKQLREQIHGDGGYIQQNLDATAAS